MENPAYMNGNRYGYFLFIQNKIEPIVHKGRRSTAERFRGRISEEERRLRYSIELPILKPISNKLLSWDQGSEIQLGT